MTQSLSPSQKSVDLEHNMSCLQEAVKKYEVVVKWEKTKTMGISREASECNVEMEGE